MDLAMRLCLSAIAATLLTLLLLARNGAWVCLAVGPYLAAYVAYRATCYAAQAWMRSVAVKVDLDRFALYEALHVPLPEGSSWEQERTAPGLCDTLEGKPTVPFQYAHPVPASAATPAPIAPQPSGPAPDPAGAPDVN